MKKTLVAWLDYLVSLHDKEVHLGLNRIQGLAEDLSLTHFSCPVITVGGTNGKGSTIKVLETLYHLSGYTVGAYTSPHLLRFNERLRINNQEVEDEAFIQAFSFIDDYRKQQPLTFFEFTTLAILYICQRSGLEVLLLEVGLGGRLDAVNVVEPDVSVISSVDLDHMAELGSNREAIAYEKSGILRPCKPAICMDEDPPQALLQAVHELGCAWYGIGEQFHIRRQISSWEWQGQKGCLRLPLPQLKLENVAGSLMAVEILQSVLPVPEKVILEAVETATLGGRFEQYDTAEGKILYDVAHNPASCRYLALQLSQKNCEGKTYGVVGMLEDKEVAGSLGPLVGVIDDWYLANLDPPRGARAEKLMAYLTTRKVEYCYNFDSVEAAFLEVLKVSTAVDRIVVFGSFRTVAKVKCYLATREI